MFYSRIFGRIARTGLNHCRAAAVSSRLQSVPSFSSYLHGLREPSSVEVVSVHRPFIDLCGSRGFWFSSSASPEPTAKVNNQPEDGQAPNGENDVSVNETKVTNGDSAAAENTEAAEKTEDSDTEGDLTMDDLVKLVAEKEELLKAKHKEIEKMQDKVLRTYAEMENVMERTKREAENSKKFAIQNFAKSLLDVADNLGRASSVVKDSFSKIDTSNDTAGAVPLLKTLLEGVEMTEKQLAEVFRKFGLEKYDPLNEPFDPHRHNAVFQLPDASKPPGTVAIVLKSGYMLYDRVIRPAEVGVTQEASDQA